MLRRAVKAVMRGAALAVFLSWSAGAPLLALAGDAAGAPGPVPPPLVQASSAVLMDARTGAVLFAQNAHTRRAPASTTKILTALAALERVNLDTSVRISARAAAQRSGSSVGMEAGERWRVDDLVHALMIASANDAAVALAEAAAGSVEAFAALMTRRARTLGAHNSTFVVPHGLDHPAHLATAHDLALITRYALRHPGLAAVVRAQTWTLRRPGHSPRVFINRNRLLWHLPGADGVKTGWTGRSGPCLIASATRSGWQLIVVALNSSDLFNDATRLLEFGFATFRQTTVATRGEVVGRRVLARADRPLVALVQEDVVVVVPRREPLRRVVRLQSGLALPIVKGERVGELWVYAGGRVVARQALRAGEEVQPVSFWTRLAARARRLIDRQRPDPGG